MDLTSHPTPGPTPARSVTDPDCECGQPRSQGHVCGRGTRTRAIAAGIAATVLLGLAACTPTSSSHYDDHHHVVHHTTVHHTTVVHHHVVVHHVTGRRTR